MNDKEKILPCPHCNSVEHIHIRYRNIPDYPMPCLMTLYSIACLKCKISSEPTASEDDAILAWNEQVNNDKTIKMTKYDENVWWNKKISRLEEKHG